MVSVRCVTRRAVATIAALALAGVTACGPPDAEGDVDTITLTLASFASKQNPVGASGEAWMELVTERTGGAVTFETYYNGSLCGVGDILNCVRTGRADIGLTSATINQDQMPVTSLLGVPFQSANTQALINAAMELHEERDAMQQEFASLNQQLLFFVPTGLPMLGTTTPVETLDDLDGLSIRAVGALAEPLTELGIDPVAVPLPEIYSSLQRGVIDGTIYPVDGQILIRGFEVQDYFYDIGRYTGVNSVNQYAINMDVFEGLDEELQKIMLQAGRDVADSLSADHYEPAYERGCRTLLKHAEYIGPLLPDEEDRLEQWAEQSQERVLDAWLKLAADAGVADPEGYLKRYHELLAKWEGQTAFRGGPEICLDLARN